MQVRILRSLLAALSLAVLAALCALALPRGLADLLSVEARVIVRSWEAQHRQPSNEEWTHALALLREARELDPRQPNFLEGIVQLYELRALQLQPGDALAQGYLRQALEFQREAVRRRPGSPYSWANIALLKGRLPEPDREFEAALRNSAQLGPWEPWVQIALAESGFQHWDALAPDTRAAMRANMTRALRWQDKQMFELARRTRRLDVLCAAPGVEKSTFARACI